MRPVELRWAVRGLVFCLATCFAGTALAEDPLLDWSDWKRYRMQVVHPAGTIKRADLERARRNIEQHEWAREYVGRLQRTARAHVKRLSPQWIEQMIPQTTPGETLFTSCPACRDQEKPTHPHGQWSWSVDRPEELACEVCKTVFPNDQYAESVVLHTTWGRPQVLSFYGGEPMPLYAYKRSRPSFTGNIRARKVAHMQTMVRELAEAYALTHDPQIAQATRDILLRLAQVYPNWLIHCGYGEYADMDPRVAAVSLTKLPQDELVYPPNQPKRALHVGYWTAGRARGVGQEGHFVRQLAEAYTLTCEAAHRDGRPIYSEEQRLTIERDLLLEGTLLLVGDKQINNKSVGNRSAAATVGIIVGHPGLVRFGLEGFRRTVHEWFLPDGGTPESPAYALMTLANVRDAAQAYRGYSDPQGYRDERGERIDALDVYGDPQLQRIWQVMFDGLQGNLKYPPYADSYVTSEIGSPNAELLAANYPDEPQYLALLKEIAGDDLAGVHAASAIYYLEPDTARRSAVPIVLPEFCLPDLRIGHMRSGTDGRESLLLLSASHWGVHHHLDSLNLYYWKQGRELLSDLGYLWDHVDRPMTVRTLAHNLVMIDQQEQRRDERGGEVHFFAAGPDAKMMRASSSAYAQARQYERTAVLVDHGRGRSYVVDVFNVAGGTTHDYVFHGPNNDYTVRGLKLASFEQPLYDLKEIRSGDGAGGWSMSWTRDPAMHFTAWALGQAGERVFVGAGWGQRDRSNRDRGATLPYIIRRTEGDASKQFVSLFEGHSPDAAVVRSAQRIESSEADAVVLMIETPLGRDYVISRSSDQRLQCVTPDGAIATSSRCVVVSIPNDGPAWSVAANDAPVTLDGRPAVRRAK
jgi:hypothetical protein